MEKGALQKDRMGRRFGLRTLLAFVTLFGFVAGLAVWGVQRIHRRSELRACATAILFRARDWESVRLAKSFGDEIIPELKRQSDDFAELDSTSGLLVAQILADNPSPASLAMSRDLYARDNTLQRLVGAIALAKQGELRDESFLKQVVERGISRYRTRTGIAENDLNDPLGRQWGAYEVQLALVALGNMNTAQTVSLLVTVLETRLPDYWINSLACDALAESGDPSVVPVLRDCLRDCEFHALRECFRALLALGDDDAVSLAIERVSPDIEGYNSGFLVAELNRVTGQNLGYDREAWRAWWKSRQDGASGR